MEKETAKPKPVPKTGDGAELIVWSGMIAVGMVGAAIAFRKRGKNNS